MSACSPETVLQLCNPVLLLFVYVRFRCRYVWYRGVVLYGVVPHPPIFFTIGQKTLLLEGKSVKQYIERSEIGRVFACRQPPCFCAEAGLLACRYFA